MAKSPEQWVEEIEAAITAILAGGVSSYSIAGRSFTKHDLGQLRDMLEFYESRAARKRGGITSIADMRAR
jgi:hypothetical protein